MLAEAAMGIKINAQLEDTEYIRNVHRYESNPSFRLLYTIILLLSRHACLSGYPRLL
jgi:hypothetical protein